MEFKHAIFGVVVSLLLISCSNETVSSTDTSSFFDDSSTGNDNSTSTIHTHTFDETIWEYDDDYHWNKSTCGHEVVDNKEMHSFKEMVVDPTYEDAGYTSHICSVCGYSYNDTETYSTKRKEELGMVPVIDAAKKKLTYGLYPQNHIKDAATISALDALTKAEGNGWYLYNNEYYAKQKANPHGQYPSFTNGTTIVYGETYWFKCMPIEWDILASEDGTYSLASTLLLDAYQYNEYYKERENGYYANNYLNSELRSWLIHDFYNAAFSLDSSRIQTTLVDNSALTTDSSGNNYACTNTLDKVYLLSYQDYLNENYGFTSDCYSTSKRVCKVTDYALVNHAAHIYGKGMYWTRSPDSSGSVWAHYVDRDGAIYSCSVNVDANSIRPAITIKI